MVRYMMRLKSLLLLVVFILTAAYSFSQEIGLDEQVGPEVEAVSNEEASVEAVPVEAAPVEASSPEDWFFGRPIRDIVFTGLRSASQSDLDALMEPYKGRIYDENIYIEILTRLFALEFFSNIEASTYRADAQGSAVIIRFTVTELPVIGRINITGNSGIRRNDILDVVTTKAGDFQNQTQIRADA